MAGIGQRYGRATAIRQLPRWEVEFPAASEENSPDRLKIDLARLGVVSLAAFYIGTSLHIASQRLLWYDEAMTLLVSRLPHWTQIWHVLGQATDTNPPTYYMLIRALGSLFGPSAMVLRLPSAIALGVGIWLTYECARLLTDRWSALIAPALLTVSGLPYYGYEARPYAILLMLTALALWVWLRFPRQRIDSAVVFGAVILAGMMTHYYMVLGLAPYFLAEYWPIRRWHRPPPMLLAGIAAVLLSAPVFAAIVSGAHHAYAPLLRGWVPLQYFIETYPALFPDAAWTVGLCALWIALASRRTRFEPTPAMSGDERLGWLFLSLPPVVYLFGVFVSHAYHERYALATLVGISVAVACALGRQFRGEPWILGGVIALLTFLGLWAQIATARHPAGVEAFPLRQQAMTRGMIELEPALNAAGKRYTLVLPMTLYLDGFVNSHAQGRYALLVFSDHVDRAKPELLSLDIANSERRLSQYYPLHLWNVDELKRHAAETALIEPTSADLTALRAAGLEVEQRYSKPVSVYFASLSADNRPSLDGGDRLAMGLH